MERCVIRHIDGGYLYRSKGDRWTRTSNVQQADRMEYCKAKNVLENCISPTFRKYWEIVPAEEELVAIHPVLTEETGDVFTWSEVLSAQEKLHRELTQYRMDLNDRLSEVDLEICDIEHYIEFFALDAAKGYKAYRMLKERLIHRRHIKDEMAKAGLLLSGFAADFSERNMDQQLRKLENKKYAPRILAELFGNEKSA